jgi:glutamate racemase
MQNNSSIPRVLVFDSGVGGLSITREIQQKLAQVKIIYASDNAFFPYGTKTESELITRVDSVLWLSHVIPQVHLLCRICVRI